MRTSINMEALQFPVGEYIPQKTATPETIRNWIEDIEKFPARLIELTQKLKHRTIELEISSRWMVNQASSASLR